MVGSYVINLFIVVNVFPWLQEQSRETGKE